MRSTVIPQARKTKPSIYEHVSMYTSLSIFFFIYKKEKNATKKKVLEITGGLSSGSLLFHAFRYFTEVLLFNTILQFFFVQLNCVMNGYYYFWPKFSADTSTNALREKKKTFECGTSDFLLIIVR